MGAKIMNENRHSIDEKAGAQTVAFQRPTDFFTAEEIAYLREINPWRSALAIAHCWGVIVGTWIVVSLFPNPLTITLGVMIIGATVGVVCAHPRRCSRCAVQEP